MSTDFMPTVVEQGSNVLVCDPTPIEGLVFCQEPECGRPVYEDDRCKRCRDIWLYKTNKLTTEWMIPMFPECDAPRPGTHAGHQWHTNHFQKPCARCVLAHREERAREHVRYAR